MLERQRLDGAEILVVSPTPTWPLDHGNRKRIHSVCQSLQARGAIIHFLYYPSEGDWRRHFPKHAEKKMQAQWEYYYRVTPSIALHMSAKGDSHTIDEWWDDAVEDEVKWLCERNDFQAMIVNYSWLSKALTFAPKRCLRVLDTHDRFSGRGAMLEAHGIDKEFFHTSQKEEFKALERADIVWAIKHEEELFFRKLLETYEHEEEIKPLSPYAAAQEPEEVDDYDYAATEVKTLLHVEERESFDFDFPNARNGYLTVGIVGAYNNINLTNTREFLTHALPFFEKHMTPVKVLLAGSMCKGLKDIDHPFVEQLGRVESMDDFYTQIDIALVPMTFSTGLKIKAGEALAYGVPLIAHAHAFEGYPVCHPWQASPSLDAVAEAVVACAFDRKKVAELKTASDDAQSALKNEVNATLDHFTQTLKEHCATALIVLPKFVPGDYSLRKLIIDEIIRTLGETYRYGFYYPYVLDEETEIYLAELSTSGLVFCEDEATKLSQLRGATVLQEVQKVWPFALLWNLSDRAVSKVDFEKDFRYFRDRSFQNASASTVQDDYDVLVRTTSSDSYTATRHLEWYKNPFFGRIEAMYKQMWGEKKDSESNAVYILMSGTKTQMRFWHRVYEQMLSSRYRLYWIIDSQEVDWPVERRLEAEAVARDYSLLKTAARCALMVNLGRSDLLMTIAWSMFVCKRRIYDLEEIGVHDGKLTLSLLYKETLRSLETLDLNNYSNRFQHNAVFKPELDTVMRQAQKREVPEWLRLKI